MYDDRYSKPLIIFIMATVACLLWGSAFPSIKISYELLGIGDAGSLVKLQFAGYRFFLAGMYLLLFIVVKKKPLGLSREAFMPIVFLGLIQTTLFICWFWTVVCVA